MKNKKGKLMVITGFPAAGKDTLLSMFLKKRPDFSMIVSHTNRPIRPGEKNGVNHHFVSKKKFEELIEKDAFLEHVLTGSHYKGTTKNEFDKVLKGGNVVWRIDVSRIVILEETFRDKLGNSAANEIISRTTKIVIKAPNVSVARKRYLSRNPDSPLIEEFDRRMEKEMALWNKHKHKFSNVIVNKNGKQDEAVEEMLNLALLSYKSR